MTKINHIGLLTSCVIPNTKTGPITKFTKEERFSDLAKNLNYLYETKIFQKIYVVDPFLENIKSSQIFKKLLIKNGLKNRIKLNLLLFKPSKNTRRKINLMGKGYSELRMIIDSSKFIKKEFKKSIIHKISGRYKILNIVDLIKKSENILHEKKLFYLTYSKIFSKCFTVIISFRSDTKQKLLNICLKDINDKKGNYIEHSIYKNIVEKNLASRNKNLPKFEYNMVGGSNQGRYGRFKQFKNKLIYGYI